MPLRIFTPTETALGRFPTAGHPFRASGVARCQPAVPASRNHRWPSQPWNGRASAKKTLASAASARILRVEEPLVDQQLSKFAELTRSELWRDQMWTKLGMVAILASLLASTADLGYARAADGRATESGTTSSGGAAVGGGNGPSGTALGGGDRSIHTTPSEASPGMTSPGMSGGAGSGSSEPATGSSTGAIGSGSSAPANPR
jgi:hypothetical protein